LEEEGKKGGIHYKLKLVGSEGNTGKEQVV